MSAKSRKLNAVEQKIHQAFLSANNMTLTQNQVDAVEPDQKKRMDAINFLLATGLIRVLVDGKGSISAYRAVGKKEVEAKKDLAQEELLVLNHIQASGNEGIWTKHLKTKTELHQTVIDRCLKSLVNKKLIKRIENVKYPTRKIYMLYELEPSSAITGGPWYTDNELDTEFIKLLMDACMKFIREKSFPRGKGDALFPISAAPAYPTTQQIRTFLQKARITETELTEEHIEMLLNVLITDGQIERLPAFGAALWEANSRADEMESDDGDRQRKRKKKDSSDEREKKRRRKAGSIVLSDSESGSDEDIKSENGGSDADKSEEERDGGISNRPALNAEDFGGAYVYRAIRQERVALGWSEAPCGRCPQFEFCKDGGPVNPRDCHYYGGWLAQTEIAIE
ncbi:RPC34 [Sanghuangporus vaninii]